MPLGVEAADGYDHSQSSMAPLAVADTEEAFGDTEDMEAAEAVVPASAPAAAAPAGQVPTRPDGASSPAPTQAVISEFSRKQPLTNKLQVSGSCQLKLSSQMHG